MMMMMMMMIRVCDPVILFVILSVTCLSNVRSPHDKTKTAETKIAQLSTGIFHMITRPAISLLLGQKVKRRSHKVQKTY